MKAEWSDETDISVCLCCGQNFMKRPEDAVPLTPEQCDRAFQIFDALGYTREDLLGKHRAQIDYQAPGFAEWLQGQ